MEITFEVNDIILAAYEFAKVYKHEYITAEHILHAICLNDRFVEAIKDLNADIEEIKSDLEKYFKENINKTEKDEVFESYNFQQVLFRASQQAIFSERRKISMEHIISAFYDLEECYATYYLLKQGIEKRELLFILSHSEKTENIEPQKVTSIKEEEVTVEPKKAITNSIMINLNELVKEENRDKLIGREDIIERTIQILCRRTKNNPIHVGEPGVGKTAITLGLATLINDGRVPKKLLGAEIFLLDLGAALAGTKYRGDFEERIKKVLDELKSHVNPIVYIDEIHNIVGAGSLSGGALDASNLLKPYLMEGKIKFIGATTFDEFKKHFEKDKALSRRFQKVEVKETSIEESIEILMGLKENYQKHHKVKYTDEAIKSAVTLSSKYINDRFLPDKAIDIIDEAGAYVSMNSLENDIEDTIIDEDKIEEVISKICNIPKKTVEKDEKEALKILESELKLKVYGQDEAIDDVVRCIKISRAGLRDDNKPVASMLFVGPTGVGKTEIARVLSDTLGVKLIRFDMSEYAEKHAASKLIGAPPGYVGYEEGGLLTDSVKKNPYAVLLLDEIEKSHGDILSVLLQVMDYATLTDNQGRKADFRNIIIIMTSNAGAKEIGKKLVGFGERTIKGTAIMEEVKKVFMPEFRNRLDKIVVFNHVNEEIAIKITTKEIAIFNKQLEGKKVKLTFTEECIKHIANKGTSAEYGAREIQRIVNSEIKSLLIDEILFGSLSNGGRAEITIEDGKYKLNI